jgi:hypothetical protein
MADELALQRDVTRAGKAKELLESELLIAAYAEVEKGLVEGWITSQPRDTDGRERLWHSLQANRRHKAMLESVVSNGNLAKKELERIHADAERKQALGIS